MEPKAELTIKILKSKWLEIPVFSQKLPLIPAVSLQKKVPVDHLSASLDHLSFAVPCPIIKIPIASIEIKNNLTTEIFSENLCHLSVIPELSAKKTTLHKFSQHLPHTTLQMIPTKEKIHVQKKDPKTLTLLTPVESEAFPEEKEWIFKLILHSYPLLHKEDIVLFRMYTALPVKAIRKNFFKNRTLYLELDISRIKDSPLVTRIWFVDRANRIPRWVDSRESKEPEKISHPLFFNPFKPK